MPRVFFGLAEREALVRTLRFDKMRQHFGPKLAPAFSAYGTSMCLTAAGVPAGGQNASRNGVLSLRTPGFPFFSGALELTGH